MDDFLKSFHSDAERAIYISAFRTLISLEDYVSYKAEFLNDTEYYFKAVFYYGQIEGEEFEFELMNQSSFNDYQAKVNEIANQVNVDFNSTVNSISLFMKDPWTVPVNNKCPGNLDTAEQRAHLHCVVAVVGLGPLTLH